MLVIISVVLINITVLMLQKKIIKSCWLILKNALNRNVPNNGLTVKKILSVFLPFKIAIRVVELKLAAGPSASLEKAAKQQLTSADALRPMTV